MAVTTNTINVNGGNDDWTRADVMTALETVFGTSHLNWNSGTQQNGVPVCCLYPGQTATAASMNGMLLDNAGTNETRIFGGSDSNSYWDRCGGGDVSWTLGGIKIGSGLSIDGNGVVTASGSASTPSIADVNSTTGSIADDAAANLNITAHKAYTLFKVTVSKPSWVRIYCDAASRTADVNRSESNDPTPGSGVIAEVRTTSDNQAVLITPGIQGFNNDSPSRTSNIYTSVTNRSGSATAVTVTLTVLQTGSQEDLI